MGAPRKWKLLCLVLLLANVVMFRLWFSARLDYSEAAEILANKSSERGLLDAERDFRAGTVRVYALETREHPRLPLQTTPLQASFIGRKDGPFEIWSWPRYRSDRSERLDLLRDSAYVDTYNARMRILSERFTNRTNRPVSGMSSADPQAAPDEAKQ
jgi:hypothetical protein